MWNPEQYERYRDERSRPFFDLVRRVGAHDPATVYDLGCGPGTLTATLADRWPGAIVVGIDSDEAMLRAAADRAMPVRLVFDQGDITTWQPSEAADVIISNAALQWVPGHVAMLERFVHALRPGGWLAFQVPNNFGDRHHRVISELQMSPRWVDRLGPAFGRYYDVLDPSGYADALGSLGCTVDAWETTYLHILDGDDPVLEWVRGTALRPTMAALGDDASDFVEELAPLLRSAYPRRTWGTAFPFRRVFVVAQRFR